MSLWEYANPVKFLRLSRKLRPWVTLGAVLGCSIGIVWGFFFTPEERVQGASVKIIYLHVPSALVAINAWFLMFVASLIWLIRRHHVSALAAKAAAPIGAVMTLIGLITGALWGQQTWGSWWEWDPRLTSFLILFVFYIGYIALWDAIEDPDLAADLTAILCLVGSVFAVLSRYASLFFNQGLHQDASMSVDKAENVSDVFWQPLVLSMAGFILLALALTLLRTETEIFKRRTAALIRREVH